MRIKSRRKEGVSIQLDHIYTGDCLEVLKTLPDESVHCCVTSPPYYALRDYGLDAQIGQEDTPELLAEQVRHVTAERIFDAMQTASLDTVYFLKGKEA